MNIVRLLDLRAAQLPDATALIGYSRRRTSWSALHRRVGALAAAMQRRGVEAGDRVALLVRNGPSFIEITLAAARIGGVLVPLNWRLTRSEISEQIADCEPRLIFAEGAFRTALGSMWSAEIEADTLGADLEREIARSEDHAEAIGVDPSHPLGIFYTGGTTGRAKGVVLSHENLLANARNVGAQIAYQPSDLHVHAMPLFHLADLGLFFCQLFQAGSHAFLPQFRPDEFITTIAELGGTTALLAPSAIQALLAEPSLERHDLSSWRLLWYGGSPVAPDTILRMMQKFPCALVQGYGQTEATHTICLMRDEEHRAAAERPDLLQSCGRAIGGVEVQLEATDGGAHGPEEIGEILARGPTVMQGYWRRPEESEAALADGWLHTGDLARRDGEGRLFIIDRKKDMIVSGAENVYSAEVERALGSHPDVAECAAIAVPDERLGERVHAVVVLRSGAGADANALTEHCRALIAGYKIPRSFEFTNSLPRSAAGKVQKTALRAPHWADQIRQVG
jgi:acyl-CoA synthetase (AMP-forming)/AMP-acid ligase II